MSRYYMKIVNDDKRPFHIIDAKPNINGVSGLCIRKYSDDSAAFKFCVKANANDGKSKPQRPRFKLNPNFTERMKYSPKLGWIPKPFRKSKYNP